VKGKILFKILVHVGFMCTNAAATTAVLQDMTSGMDGHSLFTDGALTLVVLACALLYYTVNFTEVFQW
jgi:hypothetical protein